MLEYSQVGAPQLTGAAGETPTRSRRRKPGARWAGCGARLDRVITEGIPIEADGHGNGHGDGHRARRLRPRPSP